jgi:hypothetical protein
VNGSNDSPLSAHDMLPSFAMCLRVQALTHLLQATTTARAAGAAYWEATVQAFTAICELKKMLLAADASACPAALRDGSWDAQGVQDVTYAICASDFAARCLDPCLLDLWVIIINAASCIIDHAMVTLSMAWCCTSPGISGRRQPLLSSGVGGGRRCCAQCRLCWNAAAELPALRPKMAQRQRMQTLLLRQSVPCKNCWCALHMLPVRTPCCCQPSVANASKVHGR